jgi:hypothetical protein
LNNVDRSTEAGTLDGGLIEQQGANPMSKPDDFGLPANVLAALTNALVTAAKNIADSLGAIAFEESASVGVSIADANSPNLQAAMDQANNAATALIELLGEVITSTGQGGEFQQAIATLQAAWDSLPVRTT